MYFSFKSIWVFVGTWCMVDLIFSSFHSAALIKTSSIFTLKDVTGSHFGTASLLTVARAPGFQIRNPAVAARGHTDRQGRSRAASWGRRFPRRARALLWFAALLNPYIHLEDRLPWTREGFQILEINFFLRQSTDFLEFNKHKNYFKIKKGFSLHVLKWSVSFWSNGREWQSVNVGFSEPILRTGSTVGTNRHSELLPEFPLIFSQ